MKRHLGIDLGTTHSALACADAGPFPIAQVVAPSDVQARPNLPSFLYLPADSELPAGATALPWAEDAPFVGAGARTRGAEVPGRLVASAKSWLSHATVDRTAPILPPQAPDDVPRVSPVQASTAYLAHLRAAWDHEHPDAPLAEQDIMLTVPASFDAVARELTVQAAKEAGLPELTLLEEPQAAFHAWLARAGDGWREELSLGDRVLVCDVGGGTSDFSLIEVVDDGQGHLALERVAVGEHILLGGDNMDLALAHRLHHKFVENKKKLDAGQQRALVLAARAAKEALLSDPNLPAAPVSVLGRGSRLIGGTLRTELSREDLENILLEGFFPKVDSTELPKAATRTGFMELGLPYASDAAIPRHLAKFLATHGKNSTPTHVLFNGGVFKSQLLRDRLLEILAAWGAAPRVLQEADANLAVSIGAAHHARLRAEGGVRIRGGVARSYYVGIEGSAPAVPGVPPPTKALCVVPFGMEEGQEHQVPGVQLGLVVGEPVTFRFFSTTDRPEDQPGDALDEFTWPDVLEETTQVRSTMEAEDLDSGTLVPVRLKVRLTEIGTVELYSEDEAGRRWRLEYDVRNVENQGVSGP